MVISFALKPKEIVTDFLGSAPSLDEIIVYRLPDEWQERAHDLLDKNKSGTLTLEEQDEIEELRQLEHLMILIKAKARLKLKNQA